MAIEINSSDIFTKQQLNKSFKIYAGPGAGKTHFLVENIKNIISTNKKIVESNNRKVLCITYTNAAVDEIKKRLGSYVNNVEIYTIHGFIIKHIIKPYQSELRRHILNDFNIRIKKNELITSQIEGLGLLHGFEKSDIYEFINLECNSSNKSINYSKTKMSKVEIDISKYCDNGQTVLKAPRDVEEKHILAIKKYIWSKAKKLTHDEILYFGYKIAIFNSTVCYALRVQFPFIFVDEFQDTNPLQAKLLENISNKCTTIGVIGDLAQSIYSFQGARPSKFSGFLSGENIDEYIISGNRRSSANIIHMCNYIRQTDKIIQKGIKEYNDINNKDLKESIKVKVLIGDNKNVINIINNIVKSGGVVLTRSWAASFKYMNGVLDEQKEILRRIYNSYINSTIDIRAEITEHANVTWVRAFKFVFMLWDAYKSNSVADILNALNLYVDTKKIIKNKQISINVIVKIISILDETFSKVNDNINVVEIIQDINKQFKDNKNFEILKLFTSIQKSKDNEQEFVVSCFTDLDREDLINNVSKLNWKTSYMLFNKVFCKDSQYMTVHQAKGLEWDKVVVSLTPVVRYDKTSFIQMFINPRILRETPSDEFTRMFFVACSRAKEELYIHVKDNYADIQNMKNALNKYCLDKRIDVFYEFITG